MDQEAQRKTQPASEEFVAFYSTPVGKKSLETTPLIELLLVELARGSAS